MSNLWIANIEPGTDDEELKAFIRKYAPPELEFAAIERVEGDGSRPAAVIKFNGAQFGSLDNLRLRLDGMYWKGRRIACSTSTL
jgi:hypothetical protein